MFEDNTPHLNLKIVISDTYLVLHLRIFVWVCMERNLGNYQLFFVYKLGTLGIWGSSPYSMEHLTPFGTFRHNPTYWGIALGRKENNITKPILDFQISYYLGNFRYDSNNSVVLLNLFPVRDLSIFSKIILRLPHFVGIGQGTHIVGCKPI